MQLKSPYLIFLGDLKNTSFAKTAFGLYDWCPEACIGQYRFPGCRVDLGLPDLSPGEAAARGAQSLLIGVTPIGGHMIPSWHAVIVEALESGLDIVSGMHTRLEEDAAIADSARRAGRNLHNVRHPQGGFPIATGRRRRGRRLLTVGTDCGIGKKYTALSVTRALQAKGVKATFRATGHTGIMIAGEGVAIDAVVSDFIAGAAEQLSPDNDPDHWDVIEGQGSLFHPAYSGVSLGLLHGSQPAALILCHDPRRGHMTGFPNYPIAPLGEVIDLHLTLARRVNPNTHFVGISLNTAGMDPSEREDHIAATHMSFGISVFDPLHGHLDGVLAALDARTC